MHEYIVLLWGQCHLYSEHTLDVKWERRRGCCGDVRDAAKALHPRLAAVSQLRVRGERLGGAGRVLLALASVGTGAGRTAGAALFDAGAVLEVHRVGAPRACDAVHIDQMEGSAPGGCALHGVRERIRSVAHAWSVTWRMAGVGPESAARIKRSAAMRSGSVAYR